jgi:CheY-like chemotaxis protein
VDEAIARDVVERLAQRRLHAGPVEIAHRHDVRVEPGQQLPLARIQRAHAHERHPRRLDRGQPIRVALELGAGEAHRRGQRHPVDVAARRRLGAVHVSVRVEPQHPAGPTGASQPAERAERDGVVAAEHQRQVPVLHSSGDEAGDALARGLDLAEIAHTLVAHGDRLGHGRLDVAEIDVAQAELCDPVVEACIPNGRRAHVHPAAPGPEIETGADDSDGLPCLLSRHRGKASFALMNQGPTENGPIRVLIADDDGEFLQSLQELIDRQPELMVIGAAENGLQAIELADEFGPDAVVLDLHMPLLDGVSAAARLRRDHPHVCLIALTGDEAPALHQAVRVAGADDVLLKSQLVDGLLSRLAAARRADG